MSHISSYKTEIKLESAIKEKRPVEEDPGWEILEQAASAVAEEMGLDLSHTIRDYYGRSRYCDWGLSGPSMPRGLAINVDRKTGEVVFECDSYGGYERIAGEIKERFIQTYTALCVTKALSALNYQVEVDEVKHPVDGKKILVKGVM